MSEMDALIAAAQEEGMLTTIALPHDWCNYGEMIETFKTKYGLEVNELDPDAGSADELEAIKANQGNTGPQAPDVIDTMRLALPGMAQRGFGRVVNIASVHGLVASVNKAPYVAAKHGVVGLSKVAALEYAAHGDRNGGGITINCICPGFVETALIEPQIQARAANHGGDREAGIRDLLARNNPACA